MATDLNLSTQSKTEKKKLSVKEIALFAMLGALTFGAQVAMEPFPNIHLTGMFVILFTRLFRKKALIPLYLYVFLIGVRWGFGLSWIPYLYIWLFLWGGVMLVPRKWNKKITLWLYCFIGALFGLSFGTLYAPVQAFLFGFGIKEMFLWIASGFPWDVVHAVGNAVFCILVIPFSDILEKALKRCNFS